MGSTSKRTRPDPSAARSARPAGGEEALVLRILLWVCAGVVVLGIVLAAGGEAWSLATADDPEGANIAAGLMILAGLVLGAIGVAGCVLALVGRWLVRRRGRTGVAR